MKRLIGPYNTAKANGQVFLKLHCGNRRISLAEAFLTQRKKAE